MKQFVFILAACGLLIHRSAGQTATTDNKISESITFSEKTKGSGIYGIFEGRSPCREINRQMRGGLPADFDHLKWQLILFRDTLTSQPTTYLLTTEMFDRRPLKGRWRVTNKTGLSSAATVYVLETSLPSGPVNLLKGDENVLFILNEKLGFLTGDRDFSYTLNRVQKVVRQHLGKHR
jgi:hypothetical protein